MIMDCTLACSNLRAAIEKAENKREEISNLKKLIPDDSALAELKARLVSKERIKEHLTSACSVALDDESAEMKEQFKAQIRFLNDSIAMLKSEIVSFENDRRIARDALVEREMRLRSEYADEMLNISRAFKEYQEAAKVFEKDAMNTIESLNTPITAVFPENASVQVTTYISSTTTHSICALPNNVESPAQRVVTDVKPEKASVSNDQFDTDDEEDTIPDALPGLLSIMRKFEEATNFYGQRNLEDDYSPRFEPVWREIKPSQSEKRAVIDIVQRVCIKGLTETQTRQLKNSLPYELLKICDTPTAALKKFAVNRGIATKVYYEGALNEWRPKFTYAFVKKLCDAVASGSYLGYFFSENTDCRVKGKAWPHFDKPVIKALAQLE